MGLLQLSPFPPLSWQEFCWESEVTLPSWAGFRVTHGPDVQAHHPLRADGTARLSVLSVDRNAQAPPTHQQIAAFRHLLDNEVAIANAVAHSLVTYCPGDAYDGDDEVLWQVKVVDDLRQLVRLASVHILDVVRDGVACIGFEFACAWDDEHGAGAMTHLGRVVATGQAVCSFEAWIARHGLDRIARQSAPEVSEDGEGK